DSTTVTLAIPVDGITVDSGDDGPRDQPIVAHGAIVLSNAGLLTSLTADRAAIVYGDTVTVRMPVRNAGNLAISGIAPSPLQVTGTGHVTPVGPASPPSLDLASGASGEFVWRMVADAAGQVV